MSEWVSESESERENVSVSVGVRVSEGRRGKNYKTKKPPKPSEWSWITIQYLILLDVQTPIKCQRIIPIPSLFFTSVFIESSPCLSSPSPQTSVEPVHSRVRHALRLAHGAAYGRAAARGEHAVDLGEAHAGALVAEVEPVDGALVGEAPVGAGGRRDVEELLALEELAGDQVEGRHAADVEEVVADERDGRRDPADGEGLGRRERRCRVGCHDGLARRAEDGARELVPACGREGAGAGPRVESGYVV